MNDIRHWLLDAAAELAIPLRVLGAPNAGEMLNRKPPGLDRTDLALRLEELIARGEIEFCRCIEQRKYEVCPPIRTLEIVRLLTEERWQNSELWFYRLTQSGGAAWERWAKPQWSRYVTTCRWDNFIEIGAASESVANELLELEDDLLWESAIVQGSVRRKAFRRWQATYWKTLPEGYLVAFRTRPLPEQERTARSEAKWTRSIELRKFYLRPADCGF